MISNIGLAIASGIEPVSAFVHFRRRCAMAGQVGATRKKLCSLCGKWNLRNLCHLRMVVF